MKSIRFALAGTVALAVLLAVIAATSDVASNRPALGQDLAVGWRLAIWTALQIAVFAPFLFVPLGLLTLVGAWRSAPMTLVEERRSLGWWLLIGALAPVLTFASFVAVLVPSGMPFVSVGMAFTSLAVVAWLAAIVVAAHLQSRLAAPGASLRGWHVAAVSIPLLVLGEAALIPPAIVWWMSRRAGA